MTDVTWLLPDVPEQCVQLCCIDKSPETGLMPTMISAADHWNVVKWGLNEGNFQGSPRELKEQVETVKSKDTQKTET